MDAAERIYFLSFLPYKGVEDRCSSLTFTRIWHYTELYFMPFKFLEVLYQILNLIQRSFLQGFWDISYSVSRGSIR